MLKLIDHVWRIIVCQYGFGIAGSLPQYKLEALCLELALRFRVTALLIGFFCTASCNSATISESLLAGQYELKSIDGNASLERSNSDGAVSSYAGIVILRSDATYSYAVMVYTCRLNQCERATVRAFGGVWWETDSGIELTETADGTVRHWDVAGHDLVGQEPKFFDGSRQLVFRQCASGQTSNCAFFPGT